MCEVVLESIPFHSSFDIEVFIVNSVQAQTLGENIADNGGLKAAYHAFLKSEATKDADILKLPGLNLTHKQLFFVSFAQVWCSSTTNETSILQMEKDAHAPSPYRVIGTLSNTFEFADAFNCKENSKMNQNKKC
ncbi:PREDICTED: neprilysin-like, partial [Rhagoletis zephyria]|uniref:neprilysin-like n=1 Tax=Rhagoletis zephyria TaxID=28612 RepID=UPI0008117C55